MNCADNSATKARPHSRSEIARSRAETARAALADCRLCAHKVNLRAGFWPAWLASRHAELRGTVPPSEREQACQIARDHDLNLLLILPDGTVLVHNLTPAFTAVLSELNPADERIRSRARPGAGRNDPHEPRSLTSHEL